MPPLTTPTASTSYSQTTSPRASGAVLITMRRRTPSQSRRSYFNSSPIASNTAAPAKAPSISPSVRSCAPGDFSAEFITFHTPDQIHDALEIVGYQHIKLNAPNQTVLLRPSRRRDRSRRSGQRLCCRSHGRDPPCTRLSQCTRSRVPGSSIYGLGNPPNQIPRFAPINIADPWDHRNNATQVFLKGHCLSPHRHPTRNHSAPADIVTRTSWIPAAEFPPRPLFK